MQKEFHVEVGSSYRIVLFRERSQIFKINILRLKKSTINDTLLTDLFSITKFNNPGMLIYLPVYLCIDSVSLFFPLSLSLYLCHSLSSFLSLCISLSSYECIYFCLFLSFSTYILLSLALTISSLSLILSLSQL